MSAERREAVRVGLAFTVLVGAFWLVILPLFKPDVVSLLTLDLPQYFYPKFLYGAAELRAGRLPLWNPYEYCGMPFLAAAQPAVLYLPKNVFFWLLPSAYALHANYVFHMILAGVGQYAYARWLGARPAAAMVAGMLWAFNLEFAGSLHNPNRVMVLSWVPLVFLGVHRALALRTVTAAALGGLAVGIQFVAGYPGFSMCLAVFLGILTLAYAWRTARDGGPLWGVLGSGALVVLFGFAFAAPQLLPMLELLARSNRVSLVSEWTTGWEPSVTSPKDLLMILGAVPFDLTIGAGAATGFATAALFRDRSVASRVALISLPVLHLAGTAAAPLLRNVPGFSFFRAGWLLWNMYVPFFLATLTALGVERAFAGTEIERPTARWVLWLPIAVASGLGIAAIVRNGTWLWVPWVGVVAGILTVRRPRPSATLVCAILAASVLGRALAIYPWGVRGLPAFPNNLPDAGLNGTVIAEVGKGRVFAPVLRRTGQQMISRLPEAGGYETSVMPERVGRLLAVAGLSEAQTIMHGRPDWDAVLAHRTLLDLLGIRLMVMPDWPSVAQQEPRIAQAGLTPGPMLPPNVASFRNPRGLERALVVHRVRSVASAEDAYAAVVEPAFLPATEAIVEGPAPAVGAPQAASRATFLADEPSRVVIDVESDARGLLVLLDEWFPGWHAWVDDVPVEILQTNYAFRGVSIDAGRHRVEFRYRPLAFWSGVALAATAALLALAAWGWTRRRAI